MKTQIVKLSKTAGWIAFSLGVIHTSATIVIVKQVALLDPQFKGTFLFMYVAAGLGCLLAGSAMLVATSKEIRDYKPANHIFIISSIFMLLLGIGAPVAMSDNPFGYISLVTGVFAMAVEIG
ncbi:MAG TPA: hypothetical protein PLB87_08790, partial [Prolixibacteraceae bacterium]|nr:hypothetical protein [Prolixibacteraceae bacterium]